MSYCGNCGSPVIENANFCAECGESIIKYKKVEKTNEIDENMKKFILLMIRKTFNFVANSRTDEELFEDRACYLAELKTENKQASEEEIAESALINTYKVCQNQFIIMVPIDRIVQLCDALKCDLAQVVDVLEENNPTIPNVDEVNETIESIVEIVAKEVKKELKAKYFTCIPAEVIRTLNCLELKEIKYDMMPYLDLLLEFETINANYDQKFGNRLEVTIKINNKTNFDFSKVYFNCVFSDKNGKIIDVQKDWTYDQPKKTEQYGKLTFLNPPENATHYKIQICDVRFR